VSDASSDGINWLDVDRLISDLKNDGYEPTAMKGVPSDATKKKQIYLSVERSVDPDTDRSGGDSE
jgi:hypothetical protein